MLKLLPRWLVYFRGAAALIILILSAVTPDSRLALVALIWAGLLSDILDGVVARRVGVDTDTIRRLDSAVDVLFWLSVLMAAALLEQNAIQPWSFWLLGLILGEGLIYLLNRVRFGRGSATHAWSAKLFGLGLLGGFTELFLTGETGPWFAGMVVLGYIALVDVIAICLLLPEWRRDVPSTWHAMQLRRSGN